MPATAPERIAWTVASLRPRRSDRILEIGCGSGVAAALLLPKLTSGKLVALDRSATACAATRRRLEPWLRSGHAIVARESLASFRVAGASFDQAFAINVNLFWREPSAELAALRRLLRPGGRLTLVFEPPSPTQLIEIAEAAETHLRRAGFERLTTRTEKLARSSVAYVRGLAPATRLPAR